MQDAVESVFNSVSNLNVTSGEINQSKKGPFTRWRHKVEKGQRCTLEEIVHEQPPGSLVDEGHWARIEGAVVARWDELSELKERLRAKRSREHVGEVLGQMHVMMERMGLT